MTKGRDKPGRDKKKPKQEVKSGAKSAYAQSMASSGGNAGPMIPGKKK